MPIAIKPNFYAEVDSEGTLVFFGKQGTTWNAVIKIKEQATGNPRNLTGYIVRGQIRKTYSSPDKINFQCSISNPTGGEITFGLPASVTATIPCGESVTSSASKYVFDLELESPDGVVERILEGKLYVSPEVTK